MMTTLFKYMHTILLALLLFSCNSEKISLFDEKQRKADIYPDYGDTFIPYNIAPLNFKVQEKGEKYIVRFVVADKDSFQVSTSREVIIPVRKWKRILYNNRGAELLVRIFSFENAKWVKYSDIRYRIARESIDPYVAYRLIEPGYAAWNEMGLYQRCIENYDESPIIVNSMTDNNCMNCHTFCKNNPDTMLFHMRGENAGTIIVQNGKIKKINLKAPWMPAAGVYPNWHPDGRYIAFSANVTSQGFLTAHTNKIEVFDEMSDIVLYDTKQNRLFTCEQLHSKDAYETFPAWSPDGKYLYFCTAPAMKMPDNYQLMKYSLVRLKFDPATARFAAQADTLVSSAETGKSVSVPRISPNGKYLVFCMSDYGTFPIWHRENDLYMYHLETKIMENMAEVNSNESDSFHSWSSNGHWMIFSSRRMDGTYTRLYISYIDGNGRGYHPFLLPQKRPEYYDFLQKSYNVPEFISSRVAVSPREFSIVARKKSSVIPVSN